MRIYELLSDDKFYYIVSEFIKYGELYEFIVKRGGITELEVIKITKQIFLALNYMHQNSIMHRDIKPENILMDNVDDLYIKLTDFGFSTYFAPGKTQNEVLGSPIYMPPEIVAQCDYDAKVDVWSAGAVAYVLLTGKPPFFGDTKEAVYNAI